MDILLDAPQLKVKTLALEIEHLDLANLLRVGKLRLAVENLDAVLLLQTQLGNLLQTLNGLTSTLNLGLRLFFAPAYTFNVATAAWHDYLELTRRWFELPLKLAEGTRAEGRSPSRASRR